MDRRIFTISALAALLLTTTTLPALADGGGDNGDDSEGGDDGKDGGDDNSGSGGSGGGGDDGNNDGGNGGGDDGGHDDGGDSGSGSSGSGDTESEHDRAKKAVDASQALPLQEMMSRFRKYGDYTVIDVRLAITGDKLLYVFKFIDTSGNVRRARFDAKTGVLAS